MSSRRGGRAAAGGRGRGRGRATLRANENRRHQSAAAVSKLAQFTGPRSSASHLERRPDLPATAADLAGAAAGAPLSMHGVRAAAAGATAELTMMKRPSPVVPSAAPAAAASPSKDAVDPEAPASATAELAATLRPNPAALPAAACATTPPSKPIRGNARKSLLPAGATKYSFALVSESSPSNATTRSTSDDSADIGAGSSRTMRLLPAGGTKYAFSLTSLADETKSSAAGVKDAGKPALVADREEKPSGGSRSQFVSKPPKMIGRNLNLGNVVLPAC